MAFDLGKLTTLFKTDVVKTQKRSIVGVDIGTSALKIVQLNDIRDVPTLETYGELQLGPYEGAEIGRATRLPAGKIAEALIDIMREASSSANEVALAISYNASFSTIISVPTTDVEKISAMIPVEAKKYVPVPLSEVSLDWFPVSARSENKTTKVLLAAIHREAMKRYEAVVAGAGLRMRCTEIEMFGSIRSSIYQDDEVVAIIDMGATSTKLYIVNKGVIGKTHSILLSGVEITNSIAQVTGTDFRYAEELKRTVGLVGTPDDPRIQKTVTATLERGMHELHKVISRYEEDEEVKVSKVVLSGSGALLYGLQVYLQEMFMRPTTLSNPFSKVSYPAFLEDTLKEAGPTFAVAVGAALRGLTQ